MNLSGYYGGYYRPYYHGYWYGKRQAEDEPAASGPNPDADAHGWGELVFMFYSIMVMWYDYYQDTGEDTTVHTTTVTTGENKIPTNANLSSKYFSSNNNF